MPRHDPYTMDVYKNMRRKCYNCRSFVHITRYCRNIGMGNNKKELKKEEESSIEETRQIDRTII